MSSDEERATRYAKIAADYDRRYRERPNYQGQKERIEEAKRARRQQKQQRKAS
jgi:hypothetical protein